MDVEKLIELLHQQENDKNAIIREVDDFLGMTSLDNTVSE